MHTSNDDSVDSTISDESYGDNLSNPSADESESISPLSLQSFSEQLLPDALRQALITKGYNTLTQVQGSVVHAQTGEKDLRISSQTGSGKTVAVGLALGRMLLLQGPRYKRAAEGEPELDRRAPEILLLTPTRELASQVKRELAWLFAEVPDAAVEVVTGGTSVGLERKNLSKGPRMVVATPGRALDHLQNSGFSGRQISCVVLDEADQMLDMGFRDELKAILDELPARQRTHLVSATFSGEVLRIAEHYQRDVASICGTALGAANADIEHVAHVVSNRHRYDALVNLLLKQRAMADDEDISRALVFARTRADTLELAERLQRDGMRAEPLSGDLAQAQRTRTLASFRSGAVQILVATDVAARGIDVQGVDLVVHFEAPSDPDAFTHRSGRTGRAGRKGTSVMLLPPQARARVERVYRAAGVKPQWAPVPTADKIKKLYSKLSKRKVYAALDTDPPADQLEYATKLLSEYPPERVVAQLLAMVDLGPPSPPREITEHFGPESRSAERKKADFREVRKGRFEQEPRPFRERSGGFSARSAPRAFGPPSDGEQDFQKPRVKFRGPGQEQERQFRSPRPESGQARAMPGLNASARSNGASRGSAPVGHHTPNSPARAGAPVRGGAVSPAGRAAPKKRFR